MAGTLGAVALAGAFAFTLRHINQAENAELAARRADVDRVISQPYEASCQELGTAIGRLMGDYKMVRRPNGEDVAIANVLRKIHKERCGQ
jgi:hypothetical protein